MRVLVAIRRGEQLVDVSEFAEALKEYQRALDTQRNSSMAHYRVGEVFFLQHNWQSATNEFREALHGDLDPKWIEVWSHIYLGKIFDITGQRERAVNEYTQAQRTRDNTQGAQDEVAKYLKQPYRTEYSKERSEARWGGRPRPRGSPSPDPLFVDSTSRRGRRLGPGVRPTVVHRLTNARGTSRTVGNVFEM